MMIRDCLREGKRTHKLRPTGLGIVMSPRYVRPHGEAKQCSENPRVIPVAGSITMIPWAHEIFLFMVEFFTFSKTICSS
jgi:hypothetical protein